MSEIVKYRSVIEDAAANAVAESVCAKGTTLYVSSRFLRMPDDIVRRFREVLSHFGVNFDVKAVTEDIIFEYGIVLIKDGVWCYE